ncbi:hypothetical protein LNV09_20310 [Paucibacter sp. B2R-40]|uniref:hypothetical protein n=1 Tax=Paucibacter sp. B2R-40 TaxID=2893554 RepID=UPI0021E50F15|nr:hypothetical protein [Paucibacter sp. B2R-40]MCV2356491.1 hypothetical protein [Paucibacter sp. B2R-40]
MSDITAVPQVPTSFGAFKPVGWLMVGLPAQALANQLVAALQGAPNGEAWPSSEVLHFAPSETLEQLEAMAENAGAMAGFGYEITLLRRYIKLSKEGYRWLLVKVSSVERAAAAAAIARSCDATLAVHYRRLTVEELL